MNRLQWRDAVQRVRDEAVGLFRVQCIGPEDVAGLVLDCLAGNAEAAALMRGVVDTVARIESAPRRKPMLCGCCPRPLVGSGFTVCLALPERDDPTSALGFALCNRCGADPAARNENALMALCSIWPSGRSVTVTHPEGARA